MKKRTKLAAGAGAALAVVGASGAVAADKLTPKEQSKAVVADAAKQLLTAIPQFTPAVDDQIRRFCR